MYSQRILYYIKLKLFHLPHSCFSLFASTFSPIISSVLDNFSNPSSYVEKLVSIFNHLINISNTQLDILSRLSCSISLTSESDNPSKIPTRFQSPSVVI